MPSKQTEISIMSKFTKRFLILFWTLFLVGVATVVVFFYLVCNEKVGNMPSLEDLQNPKNKYASEIYSSDGVVIGRFFESKENRVYLPYSDLSPNLVNALVATEDARYTEHSGIDFPSLGRVVVKTVILGQKNAGGGSTITQQLAKLLYTEEPAKGTFDRAKQKITTEWVTAVKLERLYTKEEIMTMYLNKFDFLNNAVGIKSAASVYFGKEPKDLSIGESALLIGMLKNPSYFNPNKKKNYERCLERRNVVLGQMQKGGYLTPAQYDSVKNTPIVLHYTSVDHKQGLAPYFREFLRKTMNAEKPVRTKYGNDLVSFKNDSTAWAKDPLYGWCNKNFKPDGTKYNLYTDGLKIHTTIDSRMQQHAEDAMKEYLGGYLQPLFDKEKKGRKRAPFSNQTRDGQIDTMMNLAMKGSDRYRAMIRNGASKEEIKKAFNTKNDMEVFVWKKEKINGKDTIFASTKDTSLTPLDSIRHIKSILRSGLMSIDPFNGHVMAYVGGPDFYHFQYDMATQGRRQVGSTIKPYLYALAMENGMTPCDEAPNVQPQIVMPDGTIWAPKNVAFGDKDKATIGSMITLKRGLATSNNWISAYLIKQLQPSNFVRLLKAFGIKGNLDEVYTLCLGVADISIAEMVGAYTAFANKGIQTDPMFVTRIEDNNGNIISKGFSPRTSEIIKEETSYKMIEMLRGVMDQGTGLRLRTRMYPYCIGYETQVAGKTGTTQNNSDGWFMGFVPKLITGVWVGGENRDVHFDNIRNGQGSATSLPIWGYYMKKIYNDSRLNSKYDPKEKFYIPSDFNSCNGKASASSTTTKENSKPTGENDELELPED